MDLVKKTLEASDRWVEGFNGKNAQQCADQYAEDAVMIAEPFGTFQGKKAIEAFWADLIEKGYDNVRYLTPRIKYIDEKTIELASMWRMNKCGGVITKEIWTLQADGKMLLTSDHFKVTKEFKDDSDVWENVEFEE